MNHYASLLEQKRKILIARSDTQRAMLTSSTHTLHQNVSSRLSMVQRIVRNPLIVAAATTALAVVKPRRLSKLMQRGVLLLRAWKIAQPYVSTLLASRRHQSAMRLQRR